MRVFALLLALPIAAPAQAATNFPGQRFVLLLFQVLESGSIQAIPFENNTITTDQACQKAWQQFVLQVAKGVARVAVSYSCFDRGSAT